MNSQICEMKKVFTYNEMKEMRLKRAPKMSPTISGVVRSNSIVIIPSDVSSGIMPYHSCETGKNI